MKVELVVKGIVVDRIQKKIPLLKKSRGEILGLTPEKMPARNVVGTL